MKPIIHARDLYFSYRSDSRETPVLQGCSFDVYPGEFVAIQGPSGSGKSTLLYLLGCMNPIQKGCLSILGVDITRLNPQQMAYFRNAEIGFIFQQFHLLAKATVLDNILLPVKYPIEKARDLEAYQNQATDLIRRLGLEGRETFLPQQLSGGQQQRVAIARALIHQAPLILADEPTGNLDSKNSAAVMEELRALQRQGKTVVIITHDKDIAAQADRSIFMHDGRVVNSDLKPDATPEVSQKNLRLPLLGFFQYLKVLPFAWENIFRNKTRSLLTMMGISIGVAAVLAMLTLGQFTKEKILSSYADLGVNTVNFYGYPNWSQRAVDRFGMSFNGFSVEKDLLPLKGIFPQISKVTPLLRSWNTIFSYGGKSIEQDGRVVGLNEQAFSITRKKIAKGTDFDEFHIDHKSPVCIIGSEVAEQLFALVEPLGEILKVNDDEKSYGCRIIGVAAKQSTRSEWRKPNLEVYIPYTYFQAASSWWSSQIRDVIFELKDGSPVEKTGRGIAAFFDRKYGASARFRVDSDSILIAQMTRFLNIFSGFLAAIAFISLAVGGVGIANMMLVSVTERFREIGLRKALGATDPSIRMQFLLESILLCAFAGVIGLIFGFTAYQIIIWGASKLIAKLQFEWVFNLNAFLFSTLSILAVGVLSGLIPAVKAEKLSPIDALRSE